MNWDHVLQAYLALMTVGAIWLTQHPSPLWRRWAPVPGLAGQPAWAYVAWQGQDWGVGIVTAATTLAWLSGLWQLRRGAYTWR